MRDECIPDCNVEALEIYLNSRPNRNIIEELLGAAVYHKHNVMISIINLYIRENDIHLTKMGILESIYYAQCRDISSHASKRGSLISCQSFDKIDKESYMHEYWHLMRH